MHDERNFSMIEYFNRIAKSHKPRLSFKGSGQSDFEHWKQQLLGDVKKLLRPMPEPVDLNP